MTQTHHSVNTSNHFAQIGRLYRPPLDERVTTQPQSGWVSRTANVQGILSSISPFGQSFARGNSLPAPRTPRNTAQLQRSSSLRPTAGDGTQPPFTRREVATSHSPPEGPGYHAGIPPPSPVSKLSLRRTSGSGTHTPSRLDHDFNARAEGKDYASSSFLYDRHPRPRLSPRHDDDEQAGNPWDLDLHDDAQVEELIENGSLVQLEQHSHNSTPQNSSFEHEADRPFDHDHGTDNDDLNQSLEEKEPTAGRRRRALSAEDAEASSNESGDDASDESFGKQHRAQFDRRKRDKEKEAKRQATERAHQEQEVAERSRKAERATASSSKVVEPLRSEKRRPPEPKVKGPLSKHRDVTSAFDASESTDDSSDDQARGKGKQRARGRPPADALAKCDALGESTRKQALAIAEEYGMQLSTVMVRAGLGLKATKSQHIANAVKQVFAHEYREQHGGGMLVLLDRVTLKHALTELHQRMLLTAPQTPTTILGRHKTTTTTMLTLR